MELSTEQNKTMSSLELVDMINENRDKSAFNGHINLLHKNFLAKVPSVLGVNQSAIYLADYKDGKNRTQKCYNFPKREACLMAMSYSYELQAKVFDKMTELEKSAPLIPDFSDPKVIAALLATVQDTQQENKRLNSICNDLASDLSSGITACQFAKLLNGVNSQQIQGHLINKEWLKQCAGGEWRGIRVPAKGRNAGYFVQKWTKRKDFQVGSAVLTEKGAKWIYSQYQKGQLPMLKNWNGLYSHDLFLSDAPVLSLVAK